MDFIEILIDRPIQIDRDDVEDALNEALGGIGEVAGAGTGIAGSNLDIDVDSDVDRETVLEVVFAVVRELGIADSVRVRPGDGEVWIRDSERR